MRAIYILCEGPTEEAFVNQILRPYFFNHHIYDIRAKLMTTSKGNKGGSISFGRLEFNINNLLQNETDILVTTFIDFYKLDTDFPNFNSSMKISDKFEKISNLEKALYDKINNNRFIPYIQLHEFEGLLFASKDGFENLPNIDEKSLEILISYVYEHENPELLNDNRQTAPSKRLENIIHKYNKKKLIFGIDIIAHTNTISPILVRCERFSKWTNHLIQTYHNSSTNYSK